MQKNLNEDFIEEYSERFAAKISDKFFANNTHISGQEILTLTPSKQVNFFVIKLLFNNWQDESQRLESPFFDYKANEVKEAMIQFMNVLSKYIKVARPEFEILLQDAVRDTLFLIMAPNVYFEIEMDRRGTETLTEKSAKNLTKYLKVAKDDLSSSITALVGTDRDELEIDESIITDAVLEEEIGLLNQVEPLTRRLLEDGDEEESDDGETESYDEVDEALQVEEDDLFPEQQADLSNEEDVQGVESETEAAEEEDEQESSSDEIEPDVDTAEAESGDESEVQEELVVPEAKDIITNLDPEDEDEDDEDAILNSRFENPMVGSIAESHEKPDSILEAISLNHRYMFINELFDGEADLFAEALEKVDNSDSFDNSVEVLVSTYAKDFHWDMNSDEVKELLKIIFRRFR